MDVYLNVASEPESSPETLVDLISKMGGAAHVRLGDLTEGVPAVYEGLADVIRDPARFTPATGLDRDEIARVVEWYVNWTTP